MKRSDVLPMHATASAGHRRAFGRWVKAIIVVALILAVGLLAMAWVDPHSVRPGHASPPVSGFHPANMSAYDQFLL